MRKPAPLFRAFLLALVSAAMSPGCEDVTHLSRPDAPKDPNAVFTEDMFGWDHVRLTWYDPNGSDDIGFTVYRNGTVLGYQDPYCTDTGGTPECTKFTFYDDGDVERGTTYCYSVSSHYYDWIDDLLFGESERSPEICIFIPLQGFTGAFPLRGSTRREEGPPWAT